MLFQVAVTVQSLLKFYTAFAPVFDGFLMFLLLFLIFNFALSAAKPQTAGGVIGGLLGAHGKENHGKAIAAILALMVTIPAIARGYSLLVIWDKGWIPAFLALMVAFLLFGYLRSKHQGMNFWLQFGICAVVAVVLFHVPLQFTSFDWKPLWGLLIIIGGIAAIYYALHLRGVPSATDVSVRNRSEAGKKAGADLNNVADKIASVPTDAAKLKAAIDQAASSEGTPGFGSAVAKLAVEFDDFLKKHDVPFSRFSAIAENIGKSLNVNDIKEVLASSYLGFKEITDRLGRIDTSTLPADRTDEPKQLIELAKQEYSKLEKSGREVNTQLSSLAAALNSDVQVLVRFGSKADPIFKNMRQVALVLSQGAGQGAKAFMADRKRYAALLDELANVALDFKLHSSSIQAAIAGLSTINKGWVSADDSFVKAMRDIKRKLWELMKFVPTPAEPEAPAPSAQPAPATQPTTPSAPPTGGSTTTFSAPRAPKTISDAEANFDVVDALGKLTPAVLLMPFWAIDLNSARTALFVRHREFLKRTLGNDYDVFKKGLDDIFKHFETFKELKADKNNREAERIKEELNLVLSDFSGKHWEKRFGSGGPVKTQPIQGVDDIASLLKLFASLDVLMARLSDKDPKVNEYLNHVKEQVIRLYDLFSDVLKKTTGDAQVVIQLRALDACEAKVLKFEQAIANSKSASDAKKAYFGSSKIDPGFSRDKKLIINLLMHIQKLQQQNSP